MIAWMMALLLGASDPGLVPLDDFVGHFWRGTLPTGQQDTHCFTRLDDGQVKDAHTVTTGDKPVFAGVTLYSWDASAAVIRYVYTDDFGGRMTGTVVHVSPNVLQFPNGVYVGKDGTKIAIRTSWKLDGNVWLAAQVSPDMPALDRNTRYVKVD